MKAEWISGNSGDAASTQDPSRHRRHASDTWTHLDLCKIAARWLRFPNSRGGHGCQVALSEPRTGYLAGEIPDAIGFRVAEPGCGSVVIECKTSRADYLADAKKPHRGAIGMGRYRYFLCPDGLLSPADMPDRWGLLVINARGAVKALRGAVADLPRHSGLQTWPDLTKVLESWEHQNDSARETLANFAQPPKM